MIQDSSSLASLCIWVTQMHESTIIELRNLSNKSETKAGIIASQLTDARSFPIFQHYQSSLTDDSFRRELVWRSKELPSSLTQICNFGSPNGAPSNPNPICSMFDTKSPTPPPLLSAAWKVLQRRQRPHSCATCDSWKKMTLHVRTFVLDLSAIIDFYRHLLSKTVKRTLCWWYVICTHNSCKIQSYIVHQNTLSVWRLGDGGKAGQVNKWKVLFCCDNYWEQGTWCLLKSNLGNRYVQ